MNGIWSPSQDAIKSQVAEVQQKPTLFGSEFVQTFIRTTQDSVERASLLGQLMALESKMQSYLQNSTTNEVAALELELEQLAEQGNAADAKLLQLESQSTAYLNAQLQRDAVLQRAANQLANLRGNYPGRFATRRDIADHDAKVQGAMVLADEAEQDVRLHAGDYRQHLDAVEGQKRVVHALAERDKEIRRRLAFLQGKPAPQVVGEFTNTLNGLGGIR
jgi:hypothetical protein